MPKKKKLKSGSYRGKRQLLPLPEGVSDIAALTDWLEISVWAQSDLKVSRQEIVSAFSIATNNEEAEQKVHEIWTEIITREMEIGDHYPFLLTDNKEIFQIAADPNKAYLFCLLLSYFGQPKLNTRDFKVASVFENLCTHVSDKFVSDGINPTKSIQFGSPRDSWPVKERGFNVALNKLLVEYLGYGENIAGDVRHNRSLNSGDGGLDIIAWRHFPDSKKGMLLFLGQCATSKDLRECVRKVDDLKKFTTLSAQLNFSKIHGWFIPHILSSTNDVEHKEHWETINRYENIPFDRTRIVYQGHDWNYPKLSTKLNIWKKEIKNEAQLR